MARQRVLEYCISTWLQRHPLSSRDRDMRDVWARSAKRPIELGFDRASSCPASIQRATGASISELLVWVKSLSRSFVASAESQRGALSSRYQSVVAIIRVKNRAPAGQKLFSRSNLLGARKNSTRRVITTRLPKLLVVSPKIFLGFFFSERAGHWF